MKQKFLYDKRIDDVNVYLTNMAIWFDKLRYPDCYKEEECNFEDEMTKKELFNYVYSVMDPIIKKITNICVKTWELYDIEDDFYIQVAVDVFHNFHKYNNPRYRDCNETFAFSTFVNKFLKNAARIVRREKNGYPKRIDDCRRQVERAKEYIVTRDNKDYGSITIDEIYEVLPQISKVPMSMKLLKQTIKIMSYTYTYDNYDNIVIYEDKLPNIDPENEKVIVNFFDNLRPMEKFIFLQNYEYCSDEYIGLSTRKLGMIKEFINICKYDRYGCNHIECNEGNEYVNDRFIRHERDSIRARFGRVILSADMETDDLAGKLEDVMMNEWKKLESYMNQK